MLWQRRRQRCQQWQHRTRRWLYEMGFFYCRSCFFRPLYFVLLPNKLHSFNRPFTTQYTYVRLVLAHKADNNVLLVFFSLAHSFSACVWTGLDILFFWLSYTQHNNIHNSFTAIIANEWYFNSSEINMNVIFMFVCALFLS